MGIAFALAAFALLAPLAVAPQPDASPGAAGAGILFIIENEGDTAEVDLEVVDVDAGAVVYDEAVAIAARTVTEHFVPLRGARYDATLSAIGTTVRIGGSATYAVDSRGCEAEFALSFRASEGPAGGFAAADSEWYGCKTLPLEAIEMLREARDALDGAASGPRLGLPLPGASDAGVYLRSRALLAPAWDEATHIDFAWQPETTMRDGWGREVAVARVFLDDGADHACTAAVGVDGVGSSTSTGREDATPWIGFASGDPDPLASMRPGCDAVLFADNYGARDYAHGYQTVSFSAHPAEACLLRNGLQGRAVAPGDDVTAWFSCAAWPAARWVVGGARDERGFLALPVFGVREDEQSIFVARVLLAEDVPYPLEARAYSLPAGGVAALEAHQLVAIARAGAVQSGDPIARPDPPIPPLAPVHARYGPDSRGLPFALRAAVDAALGDPTITVLAPFRVEGYLAAGMMRARESPERTTYEWHLLFANDQGAVGRATCEQLVAVPAAVVRCREAHPAEIQLVLGEPPEGSSSATVPKRGLSFETAIERWRAIDVDASARDVTYARYRAWSVDASGAFIEVGDARPDPVIPVDADATATYSFARIELESGRGLSAVTARETAGAWARVADGIGALAPGSASAPGPAPGFPATALVGAGALALLLLIAFLLVLAKGAIGAFFTRLVRPRVLDAAMRASIHDLVQRKPGIHVSEIIQHFDRGTGLIEYHLDVLVREGFLVSLRSSGFRHYFPSGRFSAQQMRSLAAMRVGKGELLYKLIASEPGIGLATLVERSGLSQGYVSKEVRRLSQAGLVDATRSGRSVELRHIAHAEEN